MHQYKYTDSGDVDKRVLLLEEPNRYPNLIAEIFLHQYPFGTFANFAHMEQDALADCLTGRDDLGLYEAWDLQKAFNGGYRPFRGTGYLLNKISSRYDMSNRKHAHKVKHAYAQMAAAREIAERPEFMRGEWQASKDRLISRGRWFGTLPDLKYVHRSIVNAWLDFAADVRIELENPTTPKRARREADGFDALRKEMEEN